MNGVIEHDAWYVIRILNSSQTALSPWHQWHNTTGPTW